MRSTVAEHRRWMLAEFTDVARDAGATDVDATARRLMMLRDGAMVGGYLGDASSIADALAAAFDAVVSASTGRG